MEKLTNDTISRICQQAEEFLPKKNMDQKERLRILLLLEEVLLYYQREMGEEQEFEIRFRKLPGRRAMKLKVRGAEKNPFAREGGEFEMLRRLQSPIPAAAVWSRHNDCNVVDFALLRKRKMSSAARTMTAVALGVILGFLGTLLPQDLQKTLAQHYVGPILNMLLGVITAVSLPMIFFSLCWGICTIGDVETLSRIGKRMLGRFMLLIFVFTTIFGFIVWPFFHTGSGSGGSFRAEEFVQMLLNVVPNNILNPFVKGDTQQIIFMAVIAGIILLILGERVGMLTRGVEQVNLFCHRLMILSNQVIPMMVFLSILKIILGGQVSVLTRSIKILPAFLVLCLILMAAMLLKTAWHQKLPAGQLLKKSMKVFLIGLTTASSAAAMSQNMEDCRDRFGLDERLVSFGVPLGQTLFKLGGMARFLCIGFGVAELYGVPMDANWVLILIVTGILLSVSAPPVAGGTAVCFTILFRQLGVPEDAIGIALALNVFMDFPLTAVNLFTLQMELTDLAGSMKLLDRTCWKKA
ncbi:MAG: cation:dicarboxylase symporter family transporter [Lachnospiraceae bacterium]|nr:cation:dicarboxylase symporter family transporter [Lachnospiraceae bacterium]